MANARCPRCELEYSWRAGRGCRLADLQCKVCFGPLRAVRSGDPPTLQFLRFVGEGIRVRYPYDWPVPGFRNEEVTMARREFPREVPPSRREIAAGSR